MEIEENELHCFGENTGAFAGFCIHKGCEVCSYRNLRDINIDSSEFNHRNGEYLILLEEELYVDL